MFSGVLTDDSALTEATPSRRRSGLSLRAELYLVLVYAIALLAGGLRMSSAPPIERADWRLALLLAIGAAVAQLFVVVTPRIQSYNLPPLLLTAAAIPRPPPPR